MTESQKLSADIPEEMAGMRLDQALSILFSDYSRSRLQQWIRGGNVTVNGHKLRPRDKVIGGERVVVVIDVEPDVRWSPEPVALDIVYEDENVIVVNKPAGLVVHPAAGNLDGTLLNALLHHASELHRIPRAGIVHRLDKDTSGLMAIAKTLTAQKRLVEQLQARTVTREYAAVVVGAMVSGGTVAAAIGRHPVDRKRMAVVGNGKPAVTHYRVKERFVHHTHLTVRLETGRTHQIRVHLAYIHHPLIGDPVYGGRLRIPKGASERLSGALRGFKRQALHAGRLRFSHPANGETVEWAVPPPDDMNSLLSALREEDVA